VLTEPGFPARIAAMARSVVLASTRRCDHCRFAPRWCICDGFQAIDCPIEIDVLIHHREFMRPTSTGRLINRVVPASRRHLFRPEVPPVRVNVAMAEKTLWILHPRGEPLPVSPQLGDIQVLLLDASWPEASRMSQTVAPWGRLVRLPMIGPSRYRLREQQLTGNYSTIESLLFLLGALGLETQEAQLRLQFELHVYAGLRARGNKHAAAEYLASSPVREAFPHLLQELDRRRPDLRHGGTESAEATSLTS
jgi:tRNA-uridine aminocarboxypropyltransferase